MVPTPKGVVALCTNAHKSWKSPTEGSPMFLAIRIDIEVNKTQGKFVSKADIEEALVAEISEPGSIYVDESEYEVTMWEVVPLEL